MCTSSLTHCHCRWPRCRPRPVVIDLHAGATSSSPDGIDFVSCNDSSPHCGPAPTPSPAKASATALAYADTAAAAAGKGAEAKGEETQNPPGELTLEELALEEKGRGSTKGTAAGRAPIRPELAQILEGEARWLPWEKVRLKLLAFGLEITRPSYL